MGSPADDTQSLLSAWYEGDSEALDLLLAANLDWMRGRIRSELGPEVRRLDESMDLVQEAMVRLLKFGPQFVPQSQAQFRTLLARILQSAMLDRLKYLRADRRDGREERLPSRDSRLPSGGTSTAGPDDEAQQREKREWMTLAIDCLEATDRRVIQLRDYEGYSFEEISRVLEFKSASGARTRYNRALPKLAQCARQLRLAVSDESWS